jgi:hypothetical protein
MGPIGYRLDDLFPPKRLYPMWCLPSLLFDKMPRVKRKECEVYHPLQSSVEVKNVWNYTLASSYAFIAWCIIKHRGSCILQVLYRKFFL